MYLPNMVPGALKILLLFLGVLLCNASVQENKANIKVTCSDNIMNIRMDFDHPFKGIVFTPNNYFNESCSYAASPTSTVLQVDLKFPIGSCGTTIYRRSRKIYASSTLIIEQHRMLDTVFDYVKNVSCELPATRRISTSSALEPSIPKLRSWITFQLGLDLFPEEVLEVTDIGPELFLTYHVVDNGVHKDLKVMNCIGHDDLIIDQNTRIYQLSDPFGCPSAADALSSFSVMRNWRSVSNILAYAIIKNVSMITRGRFYVTCGAELCKETCETKCDGINRQTDPLYFTDMATKGMVNRAPGSRIPSSLSMFERAGRHRRAHNKSESLSNQTVGLNSYLFSKMVELYEMANISIISSTTRESVLNSTSVTEDLITYEPTASLEVTRHKRRVKLENADMDPKMRFIFIPNVPKVVYKTYEMTVLTNLTNLFNQDKSLNTSTTPVVSTKADSTKQMESDKPCNIKKKCGIHSPIFSTDRYVLNCALRAIVAVFALLCFTGACYSLFFVKRTSNNSRTAPMTYTY